MRRSVIGVLGAVGLAALAAYPRPALLVRTLRHARRPDIDPEAVRELAHQLPNDPELVRSYVRSQLVPYAYDWDVYGVPYYFPTLSEALRHGRGDCKSQVLVLASVLAAKGIPYRVLVSLDHIWADYPGKQPAPLEDPAVAVAEFRDGRWRASRPSRLALQSHLCVSTAAYWRAAGPSRRRLVALCLVALGLCGVGAAWGPARLVRRRNRGGDRDPQGGGGPRRRPLSRSARLP